MYGDLILTAESQGIGASDAILASHVHRVKLYLSASSAATLLWGQA